MKKTQQLEPNSFEIFISQYGLKTSSFLQQYIATLKALDKVTFEQWKKFLTLLRSGDDRLFKGQLTQEEHKIIAFSIQQAAQPESMEKLLKLFEHPDCVFKPDSKKDEKPFLQGLINIIALSERCTSDTFAQYLDILIALKIFNKQANINITGGVKLSQIALFEKLVLKEYDLTILKDIVVNAGSLYALITSSDDSHYYFCQYDSLMDYMESVATLKNKEEGIKKMQSMSNILKCCCTQEILADKKNVYVIEQILTQACLADTTSLIFRSTVCQLLIENAWNDADNLGLLFCKTSDSTKDLINNYDARTNAYGFLLKKLADNSRIGIVGAYFSAVKTPSCSDMMQKIYKKKGWPIESPAFLEEMKVMVCSVLRKELQSSKSAVPPAYSVMHP